MKTQKTWWRLLLNNFIDGFLDDTYNFLGFDLGIDSDRDNLDCMCEQVWAIKNNLADDVFMDR